MKRILAKVISVMLIVTMLLPLNLAFSFAEDKADSPVFTVSKKSETATELVLVVSLKSGLVECFDATLTVKGLTCTYIITTDDYDAFVKEAKKTGTQAVDSENSVNGKVSVSITSGITAPMDIFEYSFKKTSSDGINGSDISFDINSCYIPGEGTETVDVTSAAKNEIDVPATHVHTSDNVWVATKTASCSEEGEEITHCTECGKIADTRTVSKTAHKDTYADNKAATCTEAGYEDMYCRDCGQRISHKVLTAKGHGETREDKKDATCTEAGYVKTYCKDCGELLSSKTINAKGHGETRVESKAATCTEDGYTKTYCKDCGILLDSKNIPAKGHGAAKELSKEATCTEDGYIKKVCPDCGIELEAAVIIKASGHHIVTDKAVATCTADGYIKHYCDKCGFEQDYTVLKSDGHKYITDQKNPTCHEAGYVRIMCSACKDIKSNVTLAKLSHEWTSWSTIKEPTYRSTGTSRRSCKLCGDYQEKEIPMIAVPVKGITMSMDSVEMNYKQTSRLYANLLPEEAAFSADIVWKSSNTRVCTVDENGSVTATGTGTAKITASTADGAFSADCTVTVKYTWFQWIIVYILFGWIWY